MRLTYPAELPIVEHREEIIDAIRQNRVVVVAGDTGSGKTTQLPKMCLQAGFGKKLIGCTQPRRIAALSVSERVADETGHPELVGYKIRFRDRTTPATRIKFMTDGVLLAETMQDRLLQEYDTLIIDEAHERSLNIDFLLGYLKTLLPQRPELRVIISSATLDTAKFQDHFWGAPLINVSGRTYPITLAYHKHDRNGDEGETPVELAARMGVEITTEKPPGDLLIFMPTERDIRDCCAILQKQLGNRALVLPLFGRLQVTDQRKIFRQASVPKVIVATNIAETSLTVPGIRYVIDTGLARISRYNPRARTTSLQVAAISQASCDQRKGRCGRTGPGYCLRLFSEEDYLARPAYTQPEIQRSNLAEVILQMISLGLGSPRDFPFLDPPSVNAVRDGYRLLGELGAITTDNRLTSRGRTMARLPLDPCIARILIAAAEVGAVREVKIIAAGLSVQDPRIRPAEQEKLADAAHLRFADRRSDFLGLLNIWETYHQTAGKVQSGSRLKKFCKSHFLSWQRMREWLDIHDQITGLTRKNSRFRDSSEPAAPETIHQALLSGFLRNIGQKKEKNIYQISGGREAMIFPGSALFNHGGQWIVSASFMETNRLYALNSATIDVRWLEKTGGELCRRSWSEPHWEKKSGQVIALEKVTLFGLVIVAGRRVNYGRTGPAAADEARDIFIREALVQGELGGRFGFMQHNRSLVRKLENLEDRVRRRDIIVDESALYTFYDTRLGRVYDRHTLKQDIRKHKNDSFLRMREEDISLGAPASDELYRFPKTLAVGASTLGLSYCFDPGKSADGVTADVPSALVETLNPLYFEWLVPGMLPEKVQHLLKSLPKNIRRNLVPLPETTEKIMTELRLYEGSLYEALEKAILKLKRVAIKRTDWQPEKLPHHLRMRFRLVSDNGTTLATTRTYKDLYDKIHPAVIPESTADKSGWHPPNVGNLSTWDRTEPPQPVAADRGNLTNKILYPALFPDHGSGTVTMRYIDSREESYEKNKEGLRFLYRRRFQTETKALARECRLTVSRHSASWLSLGLSVPAAELQEMLVGFVLDALFKIEAGPLPSGREFEERCALAKKSGLIRTGQDVLKQLQEILGIRREISLTLENFSTRKGMFAQDKIAEFLDHLLDLLPEDFLVTKSHAELVHTARYLRGLAIRIERAQHSPLKDTRKAERIRPAVNRLRNIADEDRHSRTCRLLLAEYRQMIEELRISIFAPELGTSGTVSEKRLAAKWREVENTCHQVE